MMDQNGGLLYLLVMQYQKNLNNITALRGNGWELLSKQIQRRNNDKRRF